MHDLLNLTFQDAEIDAPATGIGYLGKERRGLGDLVLTLRHEE
jgi:hypothetical protein